MYDGVFARDLIACVKKKIDLLLTASPNAYLVLSYQISLPARLVFVLDGGVYGLSQMVL
jgi:hypothetical protein